MGQLYALLGPGADNTANLAACLSLDQPPYGIIIEQMTIPSGAMVRGGISWGTFDRGVWLRAGQVPRQSRTITFPVFVKAATPAVAQSAMEAVREMLERARRAAGPQGVGTPVVFVYQSTGKTPIYWDVVDGRFDDADLDIADGDPYAIGVLNLTVLPYARLARVTSYGPFTNLAGTPIQCYLAAIPGSVEALATITLTDNNLNSKVSNRFTLARRSIRSMASGDWQDLYTPTATGAGTTFNDATARGGVSTPRLAATSSTWQTFASISSANIALAAGLYDVKLRVRDGSLNIDPTNPLTAIGATPANTGGALFPDTYVGRIAALDSNGNESFTSYPQTAVVPHMAAGTYDTFESGNLSAWDGTGSGTAEADNGSGAGVSPNYTNTTWGSNVVTSDAAFSGLYGYRSTVITPGTSGPVHFAQYITKSSYVINCYSTGVVNTFTSYGMFRINTIAAANTATWVGITFVNAAHLDQITAYYGTTYGYSGPYAGGVFCGLQWEGGTTWKVCAPNTGFASYVTLIPGQWYSFGATVTVGANTGGSSYNTTATVTIDGVTVLTYPTTATTFNAPGSGDWFIAPQVGTSISSTNLNDTIQVDFDQVGMSNSAVTGSVAYTWTAVPNASSYALYYAGNESSGTTARVALGNVTSYTLTSNAAGIPAALPQQRLTAISVPALVRLQVLPAGGSALATVTTQPVEARVANGAWEYLLAATMPMPPVPWQEGASGAGSYPAYVLNLQALTGGSNSSAFDCDTVEFLPHDEDQLVVEIPGAALATRGVWTIDYRRDGRVSCVVTPNGGGSPIAFASVRGQMPLGPGDTKLVVIPEISDGAGHFISDIPNSLTSVAISLAPRVEGP